MQLSGFDSGNCVSGLPWTSSDSWRNRKKVRIEWRARSTSPQGRRFVNSIPVSGVPVGGRSSEASHRTNSSLNKVMFLISAFSGIYSASSTYVPVSPVSVTRWLLQFSLFVHLQPWKIAQLYKKIAKVGNNFCQILNKLSLNCLRPFSFCQSGEISPKLVTLLPTASCTFKTKPTATLIILFYIYH